MYFEFGFDWKSPGETLHIYITRSWCIERNLVFVDRDLTIFFKFFQFSCNGKWIKMLTLVLCLFFAKDVGILDRRTVKKIRHNAGGNIFGLDAD